MYNGTGTISLILLFMAIVINSTEDRENVVLTAIEKCKKGNTVEFTATKGLLYDTVSAKCIWIK